MFTKIYDKGKKFIQENGKFLLVLLMIYIVFQIEVPYVIYAPGGAIDLKDRITIEEGSENTGSYSMAYVSMIRGKLPLYLLSYLIPNWDLVSSADLTFENETMDDVIERDKLSLEEGLFHATYSAYILAGKSIQITEVKNKVAYIGEEAQTDLKIGDELVAIENQSITSLDDIRALVNNQKEGNVLHIQIKKDGKEEEKTATVYLTEDGLKIGISIISSYEYESDPSITITHKDSESGSSGGLMTALQIYDDLVEEDLTKGRKIIGTGTIAMDGKVGEIGGVKYKLLGASKKKANLFLCPMENLEEALKVKEEKKLKIEIKGVATLEEAVEYLKKSE